MPSTDNKFTNEAGQTLYECNNNTSILAMCRAREATIMSERAKSKKIVDLKASLVQKNETLAEKYKEIAEKENLIAEIKAQSLY